MVIINFTYNGKDFHYQPRGNMVKIYSVPDFVSDDNIFIADYTFHSTEPIPPCELSLATLQMFVRISYETQIPTVTIKKNLIEGSITYA